ncbi:MAG: hypothetical protein H6642_18415 [Caldilineaceae bacterium]|nr:hypothetical protein [Caldilineaceae bacterium]
MPTVVGVQFTPVTKVYHFDPNGLLDLTQKEYVIVNTAKGQEVGQVVLPPHTISSDDVIGEMKNIVRRANAWDMIQKDRWERKEQEALAICRTKAQEHGLNIKVVRCTYNYNGGRLMVYFSSEKRVDFRALVRNLARIFQTRIEMRQIGVRDEAKLLDGVGKCGRQLCCTSWLREFSPVSIRMAKNQQLPLNPDEISGVCGRLLCCLSYEDAHYKEQNKKMPKLGSEVVTPQGLGRVRHLHPLKSAVTVMLESGVYTEFMIDELISTKGSGGGSCGTCGGCTAKRRASAHQDNEKARRRSEQSPKNRRKSSSSRKQNADETDGDDSNRRKRRRRRRNSNKRNG